MNFESALAAYLDHLRIERGLSNNSIAAYRRDLTKFGDFLTATASSFDAISEQKIVDYEVALKSNDLSLSSINRALSALKGFYQYCEREYRIDNPSRESSSHRLARKLPKALTVDEVSRLIASGYQEGDISSYRNCALLELLYSTGARVSELIDLSVSDVAKTMTSDGEVPVIRVRGKGSKERLVPLGSFALKAIEDYLTRTRPTYASKNSQSENALFLNQRGKRLSRQSAWQIVLDAAEKSNLTGKVSPHVLRHSFATHLLDGGADIRVVQELLGHSSVTTTQIYTLVTIDKVREAYSTAHPRAR
jgi:integrase/recombinase XerD